MTLSTETQTHELFHVKDKCIPGNFSLLITFEYFFYGRETEGTPSFLDPFRGAQTFALYIITIVTIVYTSITCKMAGANDFCFSITVTTDLNISSFVAVMFFCAKGVQTYALS